jgi:carboxypeptidase Taq
VIPTAFLQAWSTKAPWPDLDERIGGGDLAPMFGWLRDNIWSQASRWNTDELVRRAGGETLNPAYFKAHLEARCL